MKRLIDKILWALLFGFLMSFLIPGCLPRFDTPERPHGFHQAVANGHIRKVKSMVKAGADVDSFDWDGNLPLHIAIRNKNCELVEYFIVHGADINLAEISGKTPLHWTAEVGSLEICRLLVEHGADLEAIDDDGNTPLDLANTCMLNIARNADRDDHMQSVIKLLSPQDGVE